VADVREGDREPVRAALLSLLDPGLDLRQGVALVDAAAGPDVVRVLRWDRLGLGLAGAAEAGVASGGGVSALLHLSFRARSRIRRATRPGEAGRGVPLLQQR